MGHRWLGTLAVCLLVGVLTPGCASKKKDTTAKDTTAAEAGAGVGEEGLGAGGSLDRARQGMAPAEGGVLQDITFDFDSFDLSEAARSALRSNAEWLQGNPKARVEIEGHCDERGTVEYNLALGAKRASTAKEYLTALGVDAGALSTVSYGEELPLCQEHAEECWARNRRAHFVVVSE